MTREEAIVVFRAVDDAGLDAGIETDRISLSSERAIGGVIYRVTAKGGHDTPLDRDDLVRLLDIAQDASTDFDLRGDRVVLS